MAAPSHVPSPPIDNTRTYSAPAQVPSGWSTDRPAEVGSRQPTGEGRGHQGPDQGYVLKLVGHLADRLQLSPRESRADIDAGCVRIALKRASLFGRAPVIHDLEIAYRLWGLLDGDCDPALIECRRSCFEGAADSHHYSELSGLVACVSPEVLRLSADEVASQHEADWSRLLELELQEP
jgi:hypothetical protein